MFDSLNDQIKADESKEGSKERMIRWAIIVVSVVVLLLGGLYIGLHYFQTS
jgi:Ni,Fe-hydrogenase I cytochrome b subunit